MVASRALALSALLLAACAQESAGASADLPAGDEPEASWEGDEAALRAEERALLASLDPRAPPDARARLGPDPVQLLADTSGRLLALEQTPGSLVLLDAEGRELDRAATQPGARALARTPGALLVGSPTHTDLWAFTLRGGRLARAPELDQPGFASRGVRSLAADGGCVFGADELAGELVARCAGGAVSRLPAARWPTEVVATSGHVLVTSPLGHRTRVLTRSPQGVDEASAVELANDGPIFTACAAETPRGMLVVRAGVEDHPLDRRGGSFGYVDSYLFVDRLHARGSERLAALDVSELGVVTPKALLCEPEADGLRLTLAAYGSDRGLELEIDASAGVRSVRELAALPGTVQLVRGGDGALFGASLLLDSVYRLEEAPIPLTRPIAPAGEDALLRLGEALFYTTAMAPWQSSEGELSRFTCETCHFEGGIDGRVHATGRGDVVATTKPLFGLVNNGPHFTRALDDDLSEMVFAEFGVAAANSGHGPWFDLEHAPLPWLAAAPFAGSVEGDGQTQRRALLHYLAATPHPPRADVRRRFDASERRGAELFRDRCASCHAPRLVTRDASSAQPFEAWEALVLSAQGPIVWARDGYVKSGVLPYVHPDGARPSSLRRISRKRPLFTNGSAESLDELLRQARFDATTFAHAGGAGDLSRFSEPEVAALAAFLELL